jgi:olefin beta-lactone synthetase
MDMPVENSWNRDDLANVATALSLAGPAAAQRHRHPLPATRRLRQNRLGQCSYQELDELSDCYARGLTAYGIGPGTRTALMLTPGLDFFAMFFALFKAGAVPVLIDPGIGMKPLKQCLAEAAPKAFIGVTKAHFARKAAGLGQGELRAAGHGRPTLGLGGINLKKLKEMGGAGGGEMMHSVKPNDMAAILFTSGSTGAPKGVVYRHRHFNAQVDMLRSAFGIEPGEVSLPTFPPFALFDPALGMTTVVPDMDPTRPAEADPKKLIETIERFGVTNIFGSPALLDTLSTYCVDNGIRLESVGG